MNARQPRSHRRHSGQFNRKLRVVRIRRLLFEQFEIRTLLASDAAFAAYIDDHRVLQLLGTNASENIIAQVQAAGTITIDHSVPGGASSTAAFALAAFDRLNLIAGDGDDFVNIIDPEETLDNAKKTMSLDAGNGDNIVVLTHTAFNRTTAQQLATLLNLSQQIQSLSDRAGQAASKALVEDAMGLVDSVRVNLMNVALSMSADADSQVFAPAQSLVDQGQKLVDLGQSFQDQFAWLAAQDEAFGVGLNKNFDPTNGVFPPDDNADNVGSPDLEPDPDPGPEPVPPDWVGLQADQLTQDGLALGLNVQDKVSKAGGLIEQGLNDMQQRGEKLDQQAAGLAATANGLSVQAEQQMTAASDSVLAIVKEIQGLGQQLQDAANKVLGEINKALALSPAPQAVASGKSCAVKTVQSLIGGDGFDFFFPITAPTQSWYINGGNGTNILFGGMAADEIRGGEDTDVVFGLGGNDLIRGNTGTDALFGEFVIDLAGVTGNDCVYGDDGIDLVVGDNFLELSLFGSRPGGDDELHGGDGGDLMFGDDVLDVFSATHAGGQDTINGDGGIDILLGTGGNDTIHGNDEIDFAMGNGGNDTIYGDTGRDVTMPWGTVVHVGNLLLGNLGDDDLHGDKGVDVIFGNDGQDTLHGGDQVDLLFGGTGVDTMYGEAGGKIYTVYDVLPVRRGQRPDVWRQ